MSFNIEKGIAQGKGRFRLAASFADTVILCAGAISLSAIAALFATLIIQPAWNAPGIPSFLGYPKNVEHKALMAALLSSMIIGIAYANIKKLYLKAVISAVLSALALILNWGRLRLDNTEGWAAQAIILFILLAFFRLYLEGTDSRPRTGDTKKLPIIIAGVFAFLGMFMLAYVKHYDPAKLLDVHHLGEHFTSAVDLLNGGKPFVSIIWPHGLHDTGLAALFFKFTGRADYTTLILSTAVGTGFAAITIMLMAYFLGLGYYSIIVLAMLTFMNFSAHLKSFTNIVLVIAIFAAATRAVKAWHYAMLGVAVFLAHMYRIETGVYCFMSVSALIGFNVLSAAFRKDFGSLKQSVFSAAFFIGAALLTAIFFFLMLGWPGPQWYEYSFQVLAKYNTDSTGFPYPFPINGWNYDFDKNSEYARSGLFHIVMVLSILAISSRQFYIWLRTGAPKQAVFPMLMVFLSVISLRTAFGRSEGDHIAQYMTFAYLFLSICFAWFVITSLKSKWLKAGVVFAFFLFFNLRTGVFTPVTAIPQYYEITKFGAGLLSDYPKEPPPQCTGKLFSERDFEITDIARFNEEVCQTLPLLERFGIGERELLINNSGSFYYPALGRKLPTKYFGVASAITDGLQRELITELEAAHVKAILYSDDFNGLPFFDIYDEIRLPVYQEWVNANFDVYNPIPTPLGNLILRR